MQNEIIALVIRSMWFILPAYIANMSPYAVRKINFLNKPISEKHLGKNKTWRGFVFAVFVAILVAYIQSFIGVPSEFLVYNYSNPLLFGFLMGTGAMTGDVVKSFFKRKCKISPGKSWIPFDQIDFVLGSYLFAHLIIKVHIEILVVVILLTLPIHIIANYSGYLLKLKKNKF